MLKVIDIYLKCANPDGIHLTEIPWQLLSIWESHEMLKAPTVLWRDGPRRRGRQWIKHSWLIMQYDCCLLLLLTLWLVLIIV